MPVNTRVQASCGSRFSDQRPGPETNIDLNGDPWTTGTPRRPERLRPQVGARGSGEPGGVEPEGDGRRGVRPGAHEMLRHRGRWRFSWKQKRKCAEKSPKAGSHPKSVHAPGGRGAPASLSLVPDDSRVPPRPRPRRPPPALTARKPRPSLCHSFCLKIYFHPFTSWLSLPEIQREHVRKKRRVGFGGAAGKGTPEKAPRTTSERSVSGGFGVLAGSGRSRGTSLPTRDAAFSSRPDACACGVTATAPWPSEAPVALVPGDRQAGGRLLAAPPKLTSGRRFSQRRFELRARELWRRNCARNARK